MNRTLLHEGNEVREFYSELPRPVLVGIEAIGSMQWLLRLLQELGIECRVGDGVSTRTQGSQLPLSQVHAPVCPEEASTLRKSSCHGPTSLEKAVIHVGSNSCLR